MFRMAADLAQHLLQLDPSFPEELGMNGILEVIRENRDLFERFEDIQEEHVRELLVQCYVKIGVPEKEARWMLG